MNTEFGPKSEGHAKKGNEDQTAVGLCYFGTITMRLAVQLLLNHFLLQKIIVAASSHPWIDYNIIIANLAFVLCFPTQWKTQSY